MGIGIQGTATAAPPRVVGVAPWRPPQSLHDQLAHFTTLQPGAQYQAIDAIFDHLRDADPAVRGQVRDWAHSQVGQFRSRGLRIHMMNAAQRVLLQDPALLDNETFATHFAFATTLYESIEPSVHEDFVRCHRDTLCQPPWRLYLYLYFYGPEDRDTYRDFVQSPDPFAWYEGWRERATLYRYGQPGPWAGATKEFKLAAWFALDRPRRDQYRFPYAYKNDGTRRTEQLTWPFFNRGLANGRFSTLPPPILTEGFAFTVPVANHPLLLSGEIAEQLAHTACDTDKLEERLTAIINSWPLPLHQAFYDHFARHPSYSIYSYRGLKDKCLSTLCYGSPDSSDDQEFLLTLLRLVIRYADDPRAQAGRFLQLIASSMVVQQSSADGAWLGALVAQHRLWRYGHWKKAPPQLEAELLPRLLAHQTAVVAQLEAWAAEAPTAFAIWRSVIALARGRVARLQHVQHRLETRTWHEAVVEVIPTRSPLDIFLPYQTEDCEKGDLEFVLDPAYQPIRIVVDRIWQGGLYVARGWRRDLFVSLGPREELMVSPQPFLRRLLQGMAVLGARADFNVLLPADETSQGNRVAMLWETRHQSWLPPGQSARIVRRRFGLNRLFEAARSGYYEIYRRGDPVDTDGITILRPSRNAGQWHRVSPSPR